MSNVTGMNIDEVEKLGRLLQSKKDEIENLVKQIQGEVNNTTWMGDDANAFKNDWWPKHQQNLRTIAEDLFGFGQSALNNAAEQRDVSRVR